MLDGRTHGVLFVLLLYLSITVGDAKAQETGDPVAGQEVFNQTCVECHGRDGRGAIEGAPDFTQEKGRLTKSDEVLLQHIVDGFQSPGSPTAMPPKGKNDSLTILDIRNVLAYLHEYFHYQTFARSGEEIYDETCVACHGEDGTGEVPGAPDFSEKEGTLTQSDEILLKHILEGFQSEESMLAMPPKGANDSLTIRDIQNVLAYLHQHFHYKIF
jgi:cbb3-type cytochrome c oxidase subunit III